MGLRKDAHATALAWTTPGFAAFDTGGADVDGPEAVAADLPADAARASGDAKAGPVPGDTGAAEARANGSSHSAPIHEEAESDAEPVNGDGASAEVSAEPSIAAVDTRGVSGHQHHRQTAYSF